MIPRIYPADGFDARAHAAAEGIDGKTWHPSMQQEFCGGIIGITNIRGMIHLKEDHRRSSRR